MLKKAEASWITFQPKMKLEGAADSFLKTCYILLLAARSA
jgi:hypothetical protein